MIETPLQPLEPPPAPPIGQPPPPDRSWLILALVSVLPGLALLLWDIHKGGFVLRSIGLFEVGFWLAALSAVNNFLKAIFAQMGRAKLTNALKAAADGLTVTITLVALLYFAESYNDKAENETHSITATNNVGSMIDKHIRELNGRLCSEERILGTIGTNKTSGQLKCTH